MQEFILKKISKLLGIVLSVKKLSDNTLQDFVKGISYEFMSKQIPPDNPYKLLQISFHH